MKQNNTLNFLMVLLFLSISSTVQGQFWKPKPKPTPTPTIERVIAPSNNIKEAQSIIRELSAELQAAKVENNKLKTNLEGANEQIDAAKVNTEIVQKNADALKAWGIEKQNEAFTWMEKHSKIIKKYYRLKVVASIIGAIFGFVFGIWLMRFVPPVYAAYAFALPIGTTVIASGWVWIFF